MPKMKTHTGAKKRFKVTATGKIQHRHTNMRHILTKKSKKRKNRLGHAGILQTMGDERRIKAMLCMI